MVFWDDIILEYFLVKSSNHDESIVNLLEYDGCNLWAVHFLLMALNRREFHSDFQFTDQQKLFRDSISIKKLAQFEHLTNFDKFLIWFSSSTKMVGFMSGGF